ncbi:sugar transferase [Aeoliella sp. ICT_H6.2]|uniref:Sugar transferase n=1 Tax=Aeoliella straminimaris TaxID=2954799 RepID=A0A9X2JHE7_9BACT|nr:sugar transferase [Aeoliella straminimaris]MCO6045372.1 sugar transferase [Aeoliella straminimaris]
MLVHEDAAAPRVYSQNATATAERSSQARKLRVHRTSTVSTDQFPAFELEMNGTCSLNPQSLPVSTDREFYLFAKRVMDIVGALIALVIFSPVMLVAAVLVKLTDGGSLFYSQTRVGLNGREFRCLKFRSMVVDADKYHVHLSSHNSHSDSRTFKIPNDPRVTWIGRILRRSSIDEMPQLLNVLRGEMSLVGPRPALPREVQGYTWQDLRRLEVKPGLTCTWQVSGRSRLSFPEQLALDLEYIENQSLWIDLKLIAKTVPAVLSADGAY